MQGLLSTFANKIGGLSTPQKLGLFSAGSAFSSGQSPAQAMQTGLSTFQNFQNVAESRKRKEMLSKLVSEGGFTEQEQALILASQNPAAVAAQVRAAKQSRADAAAARAAAKVSMTTLGADEVAALGLPMGTIVQRNNNTGALNVVSKAASTDTDPKSNLGKLSADYTAGLITKEEYDAGIKKATFVNQTGDQTPATYKALQLRAQDAGLEVGSPEYAEFMKNGGKFGSGDRYQSKGSYKLSDGTIIGELNFDKQTGEYFYGTGDDRTVVDIASAQPLTDSYFNIGVPNTSQFQKLRSQVKDDQISLKRYQSYLQNIDDAGVGLERLGDQMSAYFKTLFSTNAKPYGLSESELALKIAQGELQGLIGRSRIETVGGGVMTEQDALRIITNLGGNVDYLQNPEVVRAQISRLFEDKYSGYEDNLRAYNTAVDARYGALNYDKLEPVKIDPSLLDPKVATNLGLSDTSELLEIGAQAFPEQASGLSEISDKALLAIDPEALDRDQLDALKKEYDKRGF